MSSVDVIIPCYNYSQYLRDCVKSVLQQKEVDLRVLIIDDASRDQTPEVCEELAALDSRVMFRRHIINHGHIATYNEGLAWADADYTVLLSADDLLVDGSLARAARLMDLNHDVSLTYGKHLPFISHTSLPQVPTIDDPKEWEIITGEKFIEIACTLAYNFIPTPTVVVRTRTQQLLGGYRRELPHSGDLEMWLRFGAHSSVGAINAYQAFSRMHQSNMTLQYPAINDYNQVKAAFDTLFREYKQEISPIEGLKTSLYHNLAKRAFWDAHAALDSGKKKESDLLYQFAVNIHPPFGLMRTWLSFRIKQQVKKARLVSSKLINKLCMLR